MHAVCHLGGIGDVKAKFDKVNKDTLKFKNSLWCLWLKNVLLCLMRIITQLL